MARRYDLGTVVGKIIFNYDDKGTTKSKKDLDAMKKKAEVFADSFDKASKSMARSALSAAKGFAVTALALASVSSAGSGLASIAGWLAAASQAGVALPGILAAIGTAAIVAKLGADGIKKAFEGMKPTLDSLKKSISSTFEKGLAPAVKNLNKIVPQLRTRLLGVASAMSEAAVSFTEMLKQKSQVNSMNAIINATEGITRNLGKALAPLGQAFLDIASVGANMFRGWTEGAGSAAQGFADFIHEAKASGKIAEWIQTGVDAFKAFGAIVVQIAGIIAAVVKGFASAGTTIGAPLVETLRAINAFLSGIEGQAILKSVATSLGEIGAVVSTVLLAALKALAPLLPPLLDAFAKLATQALPLIVSAIEFLAPVLLNIANYIQQNIDWIGPLVIALGVWAAAQWALNVALNANPIGLVVLAIAALVAIAATIITYWEPISGFFVDLWNTIWKWTSDRITDIWNFIKKVFGAIGDFFTSMGNGWKQIFTDVGNAIKDAWNGVGDFFSTIGNAIVDGIGAAIDWLKSVPETVGNFLAGLPAVVGNAFKWAMTEGLHALSEGIQWIIAASIALPLRLGEIIIGLGIQLYTWMKTAWTNAQTAVEEAFIALIAWITLLPERILTALINFGTMISEWATSTWESAKTAVIQKVSELLVWIGELPGKIILAVAQFLDMIVTWARDTWEAMKTTAINKGAEFLVWVSELPGKIMDWLKRTVSDLGDLASRSWTAFKDRAQAAGDLMLQWVKGIPGWILDRLGDLGNLLISAGRAIIDGLLNGIKAAARGLFDWVGGIADKIRALKGPLSYDKVLLVEAGNAIMGGLLNGLQTGYQKVESFVGGVANRISDMMDPSTMITPLGGAAKEVLNALQKGLTVYEDMSFKGMSSGASGQNDKLMDKFYSDTKSSFDTKKNGPGGFDMSLLTPWLEQVIANETKTQPVLPANASTVTIGSLTLQVTGNLDPTDPIAWRKAMDSIEEGIRRVSQGRK
jgi:phage-related protein